MLTIYSTFFGEYSPELISKYLDITVPHNSAKANVQMSLSSRKEQQSYRLSGQQFGHRLATRNAAKLAVVLS